MAHLYPGKLSKVVPAHVHTETFTWITEFQNMSPKFRDIRAKLGEARNSHKCFWCKTPFMDGDPVMLAGRPKGANVLLCVPCADEAKTEKFDTRK